MRLNQLMSWGLLSTLLSFQPVWAQAKDKKEEKKIEAPRKAPVARTPAVKAPAQKAPVTRGPVTKAPQTKPVAKAPERKIEAPRRAPENKGPIAKAPERKPETPKQPPVTKTPVAKAPPQRTPERRVEAPRRNPETKAPERRAPERKPETPKQPPVAKIPERSPERKRPDFKKPENQKPEVKKPTGPREDRSDRRDRDRRDNDRDQSRRDNDHNRREYQSRRPRRELNVDSRRHFDSARFRMERLRDHRDLRDRLDRDINLYINIYNDHHERHYHRHVNYCATSTNWYHRYWRYGFRGGYYYGFRRDVDIRINLWNPLFSWFFVETVHHDHYSVWYNAPVVVQPIYVFKYRNVYYPTEELRDLALSVSDLSAEKQIVFQEGMTLLTDQLGQRVANALGRSIAFGESDIVITEQQVLQERAVVVEGMVNFENIRFSFKALLDLNNVSDNLVFVPAGPDAEPSYEEIQTLQHMNQRIQDLGGSLND